MGSKLTKLACFTAFLVFTQWAAAQELAGLRSLKVLVERLDADAQACNVTEPALQAAARIPLDASRLRVADDAFDFYYIQVTVLTGGPQCIASVSASVSRLVWLSPAPGRVISARVWNSATLLGYNRNDFPRRVTEAVESLTKQMIDAWLKDN